MKHTEATKRKLSDMRTGERNPFFGRRHSPETRARMAACTRVQNSKRQYSLSPVSVQVPADVKLGYLAGLVDGEGSITVRRSGTPILAIYNTDAALMDWLETNVGGHIGGSPDRRGRELCYCWCVQAKRDVYALCTALLPLLIAKHEDATRVINFLEATHGRDL